MSLHSASSVDVLPAFCRARILILGVGNVLFGDDGFGPAVAESLLANYHIPDDIYVMDVGTGVRKLLFTISLSETRPEEIIIADAVDWGQELGQVVEIPADALPVSKIDDFSLHQVPTSNMLHELESNGHVKVVVVACDVGVIRQEIGPGLSPATRLAVDRTVEQLAARFSLASRVPN